MTYHTLNQGPYLKPHPNKEEEEEEEEDDDDDDDEDEDKDLNLVPALRIYGNMKLRGGGFPPAIWSKIASTASKVSSSLRSQLQQAASAASGGFTVGLASSAVGPIQARRCWVWGRALSFKAT